MSKVKSIWSKADKFLTITRKIFINVFTAFALVFLTIAILAGFGSFVTEEEAIETNDKILWFKPTGVVVDSKIVSDPTFDNLLLGSTNVKQHEIKDLLKVLNAAAEDESLTAIYLNVSELGMYYASAFELANAVKNIRDSGKNVIAYAENFGNNA